MDLLAYLTDQRLARKVHRVSGSPLLCIEEINFSYVSVLTVHVVVHIPRGVLVIWNIPHYNYITSAIFYNGKLTKQSSKRKQTYFKLPNWIEELTFKDVFHES